MQPPTQNRSVLQMLTNMRYRPAGPLLPGGSEVVDPNRRYVFTAPWPWYEIDPTLLTGTTALGAPADIAVTAPRTDGRDPLFSLLAREEQLILEDEKPKSLMRRMTRGSGWRLDTPEKLWVDGRRAVLARTIPSSPSDDVMFIFLAAHDEFLVDGYGHAPASHAAGYHTHIGSMLASWVWGK